MPPPSRQFTTPQDANEMTGLRSRTRNGWVFLILTSLGYLTAPVFYIGILHSAVLKSLDTGNTLANLPSTIYLCVMPIPVLVAWVWPAPRLLKPLLGLALLAKGVAGVLVAGAFITDHRMTVIVSLLLHAAVAGVANGVRNMTLWELIGRGLTADQRARTLAWSYGLGPILAVAGSCASQLVLNGSFLDLVTIPAVAKPTCYVILFGFTGPVMFLSALMVMWAQVPADFGGDAEATSSTRDRLAQIVRGLKEYLGHRYIVIALIGFLLTYGGTLIQNNLSIYTQQAIGEPADAYAGIQLALRFGFKSLAGFCLGWIVSRFHAKASLLATTTICLIGVCWGLIVPGKLYFLSFGLIGAGELFYVYYLNFIVGCSAPERIRENTAYTNLMSSLAGVMSVVYGQISERVDELSPGHGLPASFLVAMGVLAVALVVVATKLPRQPTRISATSN